MTLNTIAPSHDPSRRLSMLILAVVLAFFSGGAASERVAGRHSSDPPIGSLGPGFYDPASPPPPEGTITPAAGSWERVHPPHGYRAVLLAAGDDRATATLVAAVTEWATTEQVALRAVVVTDPTAMIDGIVEAMSTKPDLVVSAGRALVDALALVTASHLDQQFLVVGAQLPEPTINVTAAIWRGASSRGGEVPSTPGSFDPDAFTREHAVAAIRAGVASVVNDLTGIVVSLDE